MNARRLIGSLVVLALLLGSTFVPLARAACALPRANTAACPSCAGAPSSAEASLAADRSCCAAPSTLAERDPATFVPGGGPGDDRAPAAAVILPSARVAIAVLAPRASQAVAADPPGPSPPLLRTTILLI
ncbi:MAG TPA: hypothetical protein VE326_08060 [Candidatus Binatia bacterium]|nr:hypothetical protein [Candidatus Binatia bacterium]